MTAYDRLRQQMANEPRTWLITGVAGFIGSHLLEILLTLDQTVVGLDDLSSGTPRNLEAVRAQVPEAQWARFTFQEGSVADANACRKAAAGCSFVLHQAGFVSVPRSFEDPLACHATNVTGLLNVLVAARDAGARRVVYASSSAVYGDDLRLPKTETALGRALSPYGISKRMGEMYAQLFSENFGLETVGLRYFNVFGPRQNPEGGYAAVIPQWIASLLRGAECVIHGDENITRDFCPVADVVQANLLAATRPEVSARFLNVAQGSSITLGDLHAKLSRTAADVGAPAPQPVRIGPGRVGDIAQSSADISLISGELGFEPTTDLRTAFEQTVRFYAEASAAD